MANKKGSKNRSARHKAKRILKKKRMIKAKIRK